MSQQRKVTYFELRAIPPEFTEPLKLTEFYWARLTCDFSQIFHLQPKTDFFDHLIPSNVERVPIDSLVDVLCGVAEVWVFNAQQAALAYQFFRENNLKIVCHKSRFPNLRRAMAYRASAPYRKLPTGSPRFQAETYLASRWGRDFIDVALLPKIRKELSQVKLELEDRRRVTNFKLPW